MTRLGVGIVGYGMMGRAHTYAYRAAASLRPGDVELVPVAMSGRDSARLAAVAGPLGLATESDWRALIERPDVDVVAICSPPGSHLEAIAAAAAAGKDVVCEKPLAVTLGDALTARDAVVDAGVRHAVGFNYRRLPALALMAELVTAGELGEVRLFRATWLSDEFVDPAVVFDWRFERAAGGTTIADLGSHLVDLATFMIGPVASVCADSVTFVAERSTPSGPRAVEVDDARAALLRFASGARGTLEVARAAPSHPETAGWWPIGQGVGYDASLINQAADLAAGWGSRNWVPDFFQGARVAAVCAAMEESVARRGWVEVAQV